MNLQVTMETCESCRFWESVVRATNHRGECRFNAPAAFPGDNGVKSVAVFPETYGDSWCGKFECARTLDEPDA